MTYVTHARTSAELKDEVCSDLRRRIEFLDIQRKGVKHSEAEKARIARAIIELESMLHYWTEMMIIHGKKRATS